MTHRFKDQVAAVTGAASGIGLAVAERLVAEGATVFLLDREQGPLAAAAKRLGSAARAVPAEVTNENEVRDALTVAFDHRQRLDIAINCAGIVGPNHRSVTEVSAAEFNEVLQVNLVGSFLVCKHAALLMQRRNYGRVLLVASIAGKEGNARMSAYSASKAGVIGLVKSAGKEFAETGITVNGIAPAVIRTAMVEAMHPEQVRYMTDRIPMKRCGTLAEVSSLMAWIVSPEASFNTGFTFDLTGGRAVY